MKTITPIILIVTSIALSVFYTNKNYIKIKEKKVENASYVVALEKSREVLKKREELKSEYARFKESDLKKLDKIVPDSVDNIQLLLDIQNIADLKDVKISGIKIAEEKSSKAAATATAASANNAISSISLSFRTKATYEVFLDFLRTLEQSLRIVDVTALSFKSSDTGVYEYDITIKTYWLK